jgi:uncharacterized tellurite resistance protein B-like protein
MMFKSLKKLFGTSNTDSGNTISMHSSLDKHIKVEVATCALFIELAKSDGEFSDDERELIISEMKSLFNLEKKYVDDLILLAEEKVKESVSIYEFTGVINKSFSQEEKIELLENLWKLIYRDEKLSAYEDHMIKKIGATMNIEHKQIINSKLWVKQQLGID